MFQAPQHECVAFFYALLRVEGWRQLRLCIFLFLAPTEPCSWSFLMFLSLPSINWYVGCERLLRACLVVPVFFSSHNVYLVCNLAFFFFPLPLLRCQVEHNRRVCRLGPVRVSRKLGRQRQRRRTAQRKVAREGQLWQRAARRWRQCTQA